MNQSAYIMSAEDQLKRFGQFLENYDSRLCRILDATKYEGNDKITLGVKQWIIQENYSSNIESLSLLKLLDSDKHLDKIILTFAHLCNEIIEILFHSNKLQLQFLYLEEDVCQLAPRYNIKKCSNQKLIFKMSKSFEFLCNIHFVVQRCIILANNLLQQCAVLLSSEKQVSALNITNIFDYFAELLANILAFDEILPNSNCNNYWTIYQKTIDSFSHNYPECFSSSEINGLLNYLQELNFLFSGSIFKSFLDSIFTLKYQIGQRGIGLLTHQCNEYMKYKLTSIEKLHCTDLNEMSEPKYLIRINAFCAVFHHFCGQVDNKNVKCLLELNAKYQGITLVGNIIWKPSCFLKRHANSLVKQYDKIMQDVKRHRDHYINSRISTLQHDCKIYCSRISLWSIHINRELDRGPFHLKVPHYKQLSFLLLQGFNYIGQISYLAKSLVNSHVLLQSPMSRSTLIIVCKLVEAVKTIEFNFKRNTVSITKIIQCILQYLQYKIIQVLVMCKKKIIHLAMNDRNVSALASITIAEKCMNGPITKNRVLITKLVLNFSSCNNRILPSEQNDKLNCIIRRIESLANFQEHLKQITDSSLIYWHQTILSSYLKHVVENILDVNSFEFWTQVMDECGKEIEYINISNLKSLKIFNRSNVERIRRDIVSNLCAQIEIYLRLEAHSNIKLEIMNPFEQKMLDYRDLINGVPIGLNSQHLLLKDYVENYLSTMFYNLTTITLHNWKTYEEMRQLANVRLFLNPVKDYLPNQTLEQGIDILEIMRNIHIFVSKYVYNMNSQIFVEQHSTNKHLDTIGIRQVANSLRTHGPGVINTTVNFTYQFLRQQFYTFSQFLFDEQIKSRLMKEFRAFSERKQNGQHPAYLYERAEAFNKDIRKLGLTKDGQTYMDLFRKVITRIGNSLAYIRLIRSGCIHANHNAVLYLPKFDDNLNFINKLKGGKFNVTTDAVKNLEINILNLCSSFSDSTDYFKILVEAFHPFFRNSHNIHMKVFFLIIPPLTLNYVEYILGEKEKLNKKDKEGPIFFDDGFVVGLAYILKLLDQVNDFNSIQWFVTAGSRFDEECLKMREMHKNAVININNIKTSKQTVLDSKLEQTLSLTERRINAYKANFNLLYYNLCSSKIFFN